MVAHPDLYVLICDCSSLCMTPRAAFLERGIFLSYEEALKNIELELSNEEFIASYEGCDYVWMIEKFVYDSSSSKYNSNGYVIVYSSEDDDDGEKSSDEECA